MKIGVLGSGDVAKVLATGFLKHAHDVMLGTRDRKKLAHWFTQNPRGHIGSFHETANFGEAVVLAVKGTAAASPLSKTGRTRIRRRGPLRRAAAHEQVTL
jgi:predicted dinucleotide-binding enzyme